MPTRAVPEGTPSGSTSHVLDGFRASPWPAILPPLRGLSADSCSYDQTYWVPIACSPAWIAAPNVDVELTIGSGDGDLRPRHPPTPPDIRFSVSGGWTQRLISPQSGQAADKQQPAS
ncbi:MAG: hypothetical protein O2968_16060, partial [Acidobacteria bacterium]|nr:hypothetical protein [Acidobacteriota bacterium]